MKLLIHDLEKENFHRIFSESEIQEKMVIGPEHKVRACIDCYDCWMKRPGKCPIQDDLRHIVRLLSTTEELILVSRCVYGSPSPFIKNVLDRMKGCHLPLLDIEGNVSRYRSRYPEKMSVRCFFYGTATKEEKKTASEFTEKFSRSFGEESARIFFAEDEENLRELLMLL